MAVSVQDVEKVLAQVPAPGGGDLISRDLVRALAVEDGRVRFVIESASADEARALEPARAAAEAAIRALPGIVAVSAVLTAHAPAPKPKGPPPDLRIGRHAKPTQGPEPIPGVDHVLAIASGKGGVGKSTLAANLAVALAREGRRVGLLDADFHGPSQPMMMGLSGRASAPDGKTIIPMHAHGVSVMSIGLMIEPEKAVIWRGAMLMGALQQLVTQVAWAPLDVLIIDLPPGTGDVQLSLCQKVRLTGVLVVSTPQDVALLDARRAIAMFTQLKAPILGMVENMSAFICPNCGHESHVFGHGGVAAEAAILGVPLLAEIPLSLDVRLAGDGGTPVAAGEGPVAEAFRQLARRLIACGVA